MVALWLPSAASAFTPLTQYGSGTAGVAAGQMDLPQGVDVDAQGNVYFADFNNFRVDVFKADGSFVRAFGWGVIDGAAELQVCTTTCRRGTAGSGAGQLGFPNSVTLDSTDSTLYVTEFGNDRVSVFTPAGAFVRSFGAVGTAAGQFRQPRFGAFDAAGNFYASDSGNNRIDVFTAQGTFLRAFGWGVLNGAAAPQVCTTTCQSGSRGGGGGQLQEPRGLSVDANGNLYVAEADNNRVSRFTTGGSFVGAFGFGVLSGAPVLEQCTASCQAGIAGGNAGQLAGPRGLAANSAGDLYIGDRDNNRVSAFSPQGEFRRAFGKAVVAGDPPTAGFDVCVAACQAAQPGTGPGEFNLPLGVAFDCRDDLYVGDGTNNRGQRLGDDPMTPPPCPSSAVPGVPASNPTSPRLSRLRLVPDRFVAGSTPTPSGPAIPRPGGARGGTIKFKLSAAALVRFGVRLKGASRPRCAPQCSRHGFARRLDAGKQSIRFSGALNGRALAPGRYVLRARAVSASGERSRRVSAPFTILSG